MKLTAYEKCAWVTRQHARCYPRWRKTAIDFLFYVHPDSWVEAVSPTRDGHWVTGRKADGTEKKFKNLEQAFTYGEMLHFRREYADRQSRLSPEGSGLVLTV